LDVLAESRQEDASDIHAALIEDLNVFITENGEYGDDMTMMVLKWHGLHAGNSVSGLDVARTTEHA
jgi:hypothetical protein